MAGAEREWDAMEKKEAKSSLYGRLNSEKEDVMRI